MKVAAIQTVSKAQVDANLLAAGRLLEANLEQALMDQLQAFLLELGKGFAFVARQQRISTESKDFYSVLHENEQLFATKYKLILPSEEELRQELERERSRFIENKETT